MQKNINGVGYTPRLIVNPDWDPSIDYINSDEEEDNCFIKVVEYSLTKKSFFHMY